MSDEIFRWVIAAAVVLASAATICQAIILAAIYRAGKDAVRKGHEAQQRAGPLADRFEALLASSEKAAAGSAKIVEENRSRIAEIVAETLAVAKAARLQAERISELIDDAHERAKTRIAQIDQTVDHTMAQVEHASGAVVSAVTRPMREVSGVVAGVKAAFSTLAQGGSRNSPDHVTQDEEMFI